MPIHRLSENDAAISNQGNVLMMVGSFAPVHIGHIDAMESAEKALYIGGECVSSSVFVPNSDSYVSVKLNDTAGTWNFSRRVNEFGVYEPRMRSPSFVDDITGLTPPERSISEEAISTAVLKLGIEACRVMLVVGSDQVDSMRPHLDSNRAICIVRPGSENEIRDRLEEKWFRDAVGDRRYMLARRRIASRDISSTQIRLSSAVHFSKDSLRD